MLPLVEGEVTAKRSLENTTTTAPMCTNNWNLVLSVDNVCCPLELQGYCPDFSQHHGTAWIVSPPSHLASGPAFLPACPLDLIPPSPQTQIPSNLLYKSATPPLSQNL